MVFSRQLPQALSYNASQGQLYSKGSCELGVDVKASGKAVVDIAESSPMVTDG